MEEIERFLVRLGIAFLAAVLVGAASYGVARRKGRDTVGWFLAVFFPALAGFLALLMAFPEKTLVSLSGIVVTILAPVILLVLPSIETPGQTKRCGSCGKVLGWRVKACPGCGTPSIVPERRKGTRIRRPLRSCFLYLALFILLALVAFGLIGYFCVPNEPRPVSPRAGMPPDGPKVEHANPLGLDG
jgi:hypothetical protein